MTALAHLGLLVLMLAGTPAWSFVFDADEIKSLNYAIEILDQPVVISSEEEAAADPLQVRMLNRRGQPYSCQLPAPPQPAAAAGQRRAADADAEQPVPAHLLLPMAHGSCLQRHKGWWTYELCVNQHVRQFHMEGGQIVGKISRLGHFESDYDWAQDDGKSQNAKHRYHSQEYSNGTHCDLTGRPRSTQVRYLCEEGVEDTLVRVDEPETCRYVLTVHTSRLCAHRLLAPPPRQRPLTLTCRPQLTQQQLQLLAEAQRRRAEAQQPASSARDQLSAAASAADDHSPLAAAGDQHDSEEDPVDELAEALESSGEEEGGDIPSQLLDWLARQESDASLRDLKHIQPLFEAIEQHTRQLGQVLREVMDGYSAVMVDAGGDGSRLQTLAKLHSAVQQQQQARGAHVRRLLQQADAAQLSSELADQLLQYVQTLTVFSQLAESLTEESGRVQRAVREAPDRLGPAAVLTLTRSVAELHQLSKKLQAFFSGANTIRSALESAAKTPGKLANEDTADKETNAHGGEGDAAESEAVGEKGVGAEAEPVEDGKLEPPAGEKGDEAESDLDEDDDDETNESRIQRPDSKKKGVKLKTLQALGLDGMVQASPIERQQRRRIEQTVKLKLAKLGLDANGPEIKVRFLKYPDFSAVEKEHTLSDEEMDAFENALVTIMVGGRQALTEHDRQQRLERNYEYSFEEALKAASGQDGDDQDAPDQTEDELLQSIFTLV